MQNITEYVSSVGKILSPKYSMRVEELLRTDNAVLSEVDVDSLIRHVKFLVGQGADSTGEQQRILEHLGISDLNFI